MKKPINPTVHSIINFVSGALILAGPTLLKLRGLARSLSSGVGNRATTNNALTDYPMAGQWKIPFWTPKSLDKSKLATLFLAPLVSGVLTKKRARYFFLGLLAAGVATVLLTDWEQEEQTS